MLLRQSLIYIGASFLIVLLASYASSLIFVINWFYQYMQIQMTPIFLYFGIEGIFRKVTILTLIPILATTLPALIYRLIKGKIMPHYIAITWCVWVVIVLSYLLVH